MSRDNLLVKKILNKISISISSISKVLIDLWPYLSQYPELGHAASGTISLLGPKNKEQFYL